MERYPDPDRKKAAGHRPSWECDESAHTFPTGAAWRELLAERERLATRFRELKRRLLASVES